MSKGEIVTMFSRKRNSGQYSIEYLFHSLYSYMREDRKIVLLSSPWSSVGVWARLKIMFWARARCSEINHVVGDIHFAILLLPRGTKNILTIHDCEFVSRSNGVKRWLLKKIWLDLPIRKADIITTISQRSAEQILELTNVSRSKLRIIPNFIDDCYFQKVGDKTTSFSLLQVGTKENKNLSRVFESITGLDVTIRILGELSIGQIRELEEWNITYENFVNITNEELAQLYSTSHVLIFASIEEGFGLPILEAQASGLPVITSGISAMPEVAGKGAIFCDPFNITEIREAVLSIMESEELRNRLIKFGFDNVNRYSLKYTSSLYSNVYEDLASNNSAKN